MNKDLKFIKESLNNMVFNKLGNMLDSEISNEVYEFLKGKEEQVIKMAYELMKNNSIISKHQYGDLCIEIKAMSDYDYDLIMD